MSAPGVKEKGALKLARIPVKVAPREDHLRKPPWIRVRAGSGTERFGQMKVFLRESALHTVCEEAACPNIGECFGHGTATFMILGDICTRRCPFCDVGHGRPLAPDPDEPARLAKTVSRLGLRYVVITSVDRDDLRDGGARHFAEVVRAIREKSPGTRIETLVPDFRGRMETALGFLGEALPDVLNHNLETVPRLYRQARPGADYRNSLNLLKVHRARYPNVPTKSGLMVGLGETNAEILEVLRDLRNNGVERLTIGQYLAPSKDHLPVVRYVAPEIFCFFAEEARKMGFSGAACAPMVRSSYWADRQANDAAAFVEDSLAGSAEASHAV
jgi:lipoic acid synthetase